MVDVICRGDQEKAVEYRVKNKGSLWVMVCSTGRKSSQGTSCPWMATSLPLTFHWWKPITVPLDRGTICASEKKTDSHKHNQTCGAPLPWPEPALPVRPTGREVERRGIQCDIFKAKRFTLTTDQGQWKNKQVCSIPDVSNMHAWTYIYPNTNPLHLFCTLCCVCPEFYSRSSLEQGFPIPQPQMDTVLAG